MLEPFFNPRGVAIIGASTDPHKLGHGVVRNLIDYRYRGAIYPVNPTAGEILGHRCYADVEDVPDPVDLAVIIVPASAVVKVLAGCGRRGIGHAIIVSGGFGETGPQGRQREEALLEIAQQYNMRLIGPNCIGTIDTHTPINTTFVVGMPETGDIGFVSQSGAMCAVVIDWARGAGVGFSRIVSLGNQVDVSEAEMLSAMAADPQTRVITAYIEGVADGRAFMKAAEAAARRKPVVVLKGGHGESGAKAVASHTGALAGSAAAYDAAFARSGAQRADTMEALFDWARALAWQPLPTGRRVAVLTNAGGPAILAVDALENEGLTLAPLTKETKAYLRERLPQASSVDNPVDILAGSGPGTYAVALDALLSDPTVDSAVVIQAPQDWFLPASLAEVVAEVAAVHHKPVLASIMGLASVDQALAILHRRRVPNFAFPERAASALATMIARREWLETPAQMEAPLGGIDQEAARQALETGDFAAALAAYGIVQPPTRPATDADAAAAAANAIGYPVALKLDSHDITHKSDVGGVVLNLRDEDAVRQAFAEIVDRARSAQPQAAISGVLVQQMLSTGQELIVGVKRDPQFGPLVLVGSGGVEVELQRDVASGIAPLNEAQAERVLSQTLAGTRLAGWRGRPAADREAVIAAMRRLGQLACDFPDIAELEINPLVALPSAAYAVDVRGALRQDREKIAA
ncbi:MAG: acetate--CoA ligase family protein [Candidatus Promineifilaceae bacterium]|nr:acetate--CoA ligase family protein [Candidatus Promineifilaceae bacterium]